MELTNCFSYWVCPESPEKRTTRPESPQVRPLSLKDSSSQAVFVHVAELEPSGFSKQLLDPLKAVEFRIDKLPTVTGYMAYRLVSDFWCEPYFGTFFSSVPENTQALIYEKQNGLFGVILPVCGSEYKCTLEGREDGLYARIFSLCENETQCDTLCFVWGESADPFSLLQRLTGEALKLLGNFALPREERSYPEILEYLGWCTWDALQIRVNTRGILEKCQELCEKNVPVRWVIIDDMWAQVKGLSRAENLPFAQMVEVMHSSRLWSFEADEKRFPGGLKACINEVHRRGFLAGVWHPVTGYWSGLDPDGPAAGECRDILFVNQDGKTLPSWELNKSRAFYRRFHDHLSEAGADFVKIDNQSCYRQFYSGPAAVGQAARNVHTAMEESVDSHFQGTLINCMGMGSEDLWNRPHSAVSRCSDDFIPEDKAWFRRHILQCSYNSVIQGQFVYNDWDMWWTDDSQAVKNSVLRAISGGPIYVSDKIGRTRPEVLKPLCFSDGRILRCDQPAVPSADCLCHDPAKTGKALKLWTRVGEYGIVAVFNLHSADPQHPEKDTSVTADIKPADFGGSGRYAVYHHFADIVTPCGEEGIPLTLRTEDDFELLVFAPIHEGFAVIGDADKYISPKAIARAEGWNVELVEEGRLLTYSESDF